MVKDFVRAQFLPKIRQVCVVADREKFHSRHRGKILEVLACNHVAVSGVVRPAGMDPGRAGGFEIGTAFPDRSGDRKLRKRLRGRHGIDLVHKKAEAVAEIHERRVEGSPRRRIENEADRIFLSSDAQGMDFAGWF